jgi:nudix motif 8
MKFDSANVERVRQLLQRFTGTIAHNRIMPEGQRVADYEKRMLRKAAVLVPLVNVDNEASLLFTVRASGLNTHAAQVSFPGGHVDPGESLEEAAVRELKEETNISDVETLGMWSAARAYTGTMVTPVLGFIKLEMTKDDVKRCGLFRPEEVSAAFHLPIEHLVNPAHRTIEELGSFRSARFAGGPEPVWGLTAFFLEGILKDVLAPSLNLTYLPTPKKKLETRRLDDEVRESKM